MFARFIDGGRAMLRLHLPALAAFLLTFFASSFCTAQDEPTSENNARLKKALKQYPEADANKDGILTLKEARAYRATLTGRTTKKEKPVPPPNAADMPETGKDKGYNCLLMGHSFFRPIAEGLEELAKKAGFGAHRQHVSMLGGAKGTPGVFWENESKRREIQQYLTSTKVDVVGMTYHPKGKVSVEDYSRWIDFALKANPKTQFFIGYPWPDFPKRKTFEEYVKYAMAASGEVDKILKALQERYPGTVIYRIVYGKAAMELWELQKEGKLKKTKFMGDPDEAIFRDEKGHPGTILSSLSRLVWLGAIYETDVTQYTWRLGFETDLKPIAKKIMKEFPR